LRGLSASSERLGPCPPDAVTAFVVQVSATSADALAHFASGGSPDARLASLRAPSGR
jgi:hypothetical protein